MQPLLSIENFSIKFKSDSSEITAVDIGLLNVEKGKTLALVGESGSGKSLTALSILKLLPGGALTNGHIFFQTDPDRQIDISAISIKEMNKIRGQQIAMIFQEPMTSLNPVLTCGEQVIETIMAHTNLSKKEAKEKTIALFRQVELPEPLAMINRYPHQISGGQQQRVMIAMAICCEPALLIADEPTTALDVRVQKHILELIKKIQVQSNLSVLLITHDLGLVADVADDIAVMYKGKIVEQGASKTILNNPVHLYTRALLACRPGPAAKGNRLFTLADFAINPAPGRVAVPVVHDESGPGGAMLSVEHLNVYFQDPGGLFRRRAAPYKAVDDVSFQVKKNEVLGLVGESGCGKTTLARTLLQLIKPTSGRIILNGVDISKLDQKALRAERKDLQIVFQNPFGSLNPRITVGNAIVEPMRVHRLYSADKERKEKAIQLLEQVQLEADHFHRYPHQFSGGQRQRICIARALALDPSFLLFDESVSALDVSVQAQVLNLINDLKAAFNFTSVFISHDLAVVHYISDRIMVMQKGRIVESGTADAVFNNPANEYTQRLIDAIPGRNSLY